MSLSSSLREVIHNCTAPTYLWSQYHHLPSVQLTLCTPQPPHPVTAVPQERPRWLPTEAESFVLQAPKGNIRPATWELSWFIRKIIVSPYICDFESLRRLEAFLKVILPVSLCNGFLPRWISPEQENIKKDQFTTQKSWRQGILTSI